MTGTTCKVCGGNMHEISDGVQCDTCALIIRSDGSVDHSEMEEVDE